MFNEYGFYIIIGDHSYLIFWRNLANTALTIFVIILLCILYRVLRNRKIEEKTITYLNLSTIIYKWNNRAVITFPDLSTFIGRLKNNLPHGNGVFKSSNCSTVRIKFKEGESSLVSIFKNENGYNYKIIKTDNPILNKQFRSLLKWLVIINSIALVIAILPMPYVYYMILRIYTTLTCCLLAYVAYIGKKLKTAIASGLLAILYNPLLPLHLGKDIWIIVNIISMPVVMLLYHINKKAS